MTDKVLCPWCGSEMVVEARWHRIDVDDKERAWNAWAVCQNEDCSSDGPYVFDRPTEEEAINDALKRCLRRYEPPIRTLTKDEVKEHTVTRDASPLWMEWKVYEDMDEWVTSPAIKSLNIEENYGRVWRCWPRKPTEEEREACGWEDEE